MSLRTIVAVKKDEELSCNYGYKPNLNLPWFRAEYKRFEKEFPELTNAAFRVAFWESEKNFEAKSEKKTEK